MTMGSVGEGTLGVLVWPSYVGACYGEPTTGVLSVFEPSQNPRYKRGQINWGMEGDQIVGRAFIHVPKGEYTHLLYFTHPELAEVVGSVQLPHPIIYHGDDNIIEVYPITNADLQLLKPYNA